MYVIVVSGFKREVLQHVSPCFFVKRGRMVYSLAMTFFKRDKKTDNHFENKDGEQNIGQGPNAIGKQVNNYGVPPELFAQYVSELGVTDLALASFFKILEEQQVARGDLDSKLREVAFRYKELLQRFESVQSDDPEVRSLKVEAKNAIEDGRFAEAEALLAQARERDQKAVARIKESILEQQAALEKRQLSEAASCVEQAQLQRFQCHYAPAAEFWKEAATAFPERCKVERAECLGAAGGNLTYVPNYKDSLLLHKQSLLIYHEIGDKKKEGKLLNNISQVYQDQGEYKKALKHLEESLAIRRMIGDKKGEGVTLNNISQVYCAQGKYDQASSSLKESLNCLMNLGDKESEGVTLGNIGTLYYRMGIFGNALQYLEKALEISQQNKFKQLESSCLSNISLVYLELEDFDVALGYAKKGLMISQQINDFRGEGVVFNSMAEIYRAKGDSKGAMQYYEKSLSRAKKMHDKDGEAIVNGSIGHLYQNQGEYVKAELYFSRALKLGEQLEHPDLEFWRETLEDVRIKLREQRN